VIRRQEAESMEQGAWSQRSEFRSEEGGVRRQKTELQSLRGQKAEKSMQYALGRRQRKGGNEKTEPQRSEIRGRRSGLQSLRGQETFHLAHGKQKTVK
jgi:hypothetical protein